jgi:hypothetical protein
MGRNTITKTQITLPSFSKSLLRQSIKAIIQSIAGRIIKEMTNSMPVPVEKSIRFIFPILLNRNKNRDLII